jgi:DNA-binding CsgD family transcriptional regulator
LFEAVLSLLVRSSARQPVVLVVEDLHWADHGTLDLVNFVVRNLVDAAVIVVGTERAEVTRGAPVRAWTAEVARVPIVSRVDLVRFDRAEIVALLAAILGRAPGPVLSEEIFRRSDGNAFFAEELLAAAQGPAPGRLPETLRDTLLARVDALEPATGRVLQALAVGGGRVPHPTLEAVVAADAADFARALDDAVTNHVVVVDGDAYAFRHATFTEAIYGELLPGNRERLHERYAEVLEAAAASAAERAAHWSEAGDERRALPATIEAARDAERQHAPQEAAGHWGRALELWERLHASGTDADLEIDTTSLRLRAADALNLSGDAARAILVVDALLAEVDTGADPYFAGRLQERLGWFRMRSGDEDGALAAYERAIELVPAEPPSVERSLALAAIGRAYTRRRRDDEAIDYSRQAVDIAVAAHERRQEGAARHALGNALSTAGDAPGAFPELVAAATIALESGNVIELGWTCLHLLGTGAQAGRLADAIDAVLDLAGAARRRGLERGVAGLLDCIAAAGLIDLGEWDRAEALMQGVEERGPAGVEIVALHIGRGLLAVRRGDLAIATGHLHSAAALTAAVQDGRMTGLVHDGLAALAALEGRPLDARATVADGLRAIANTGDDDTIARLCLTGMLTESAIAEERGAPDDDVRDNVARLLGSTRRADDAATMTTLAEADRIEGRSSPDAWRAAVAAWERTAFPYGEALARWRLAEALFADGRRDEAANELRAAYAIAARLGAQPMVRGMAALAGRAHVTLDPGAGGTSEAPGETGLTPRELDVLRLVAAGSTNRQIGAELFISEKTASVHVSRILAKLGVSTRGQAAAIAHLRGLADGPPPRT